MGFSQNLGWEMGIGSPLQDPLENSLSLILYIQGLIFPAARPILAKFPNIASIINP